MQAVSYTHLDVYKRQAETKVEIPPENEEEQKGWIGVILNGDETEAYTPVSYTHLDVYKRQLSLYKIHT